MAAICVDAFRKESKLMESAKLNRVGNAFIRLTYYVFLTILYTFLIISDVPFSNGMESRYDADLVCSYTVSMAQCQPFRQ